MSASPALSNSSSLEDIDLEELIGSCNLRRAHARFSTQSRALLLCVSQDESHFGPEVHWGWIQDLSPSGAKLAVDCSMSADRFWLRFPDADGIERFVECRVRWRSDDATDAKCPDGLQCLGVEFDGLMELAELGKVLNSERRS